MARQYFGTDGVRGRANEGPLTPESLARLGRAMAKRLAAGGSRPTCLIGRDPRVSGQMIGQAFAAGFLAAGGDTVDIGVVSTPQIAHLVRVGTWTVGAMVSASHNPWTDNGIKFFDTRGEKLADSVEEEIEAMWADPGAAEGPDRVGTASTDLRLPGDYRDAIVKEFASRVGAGKVALDCANGAVSAWAPQIFRALGREPVVHSAAPDGRNINEACGALHPEKLAAVIGQSLRGTPGFAFDGDADRVIAIDEDGRVVDGDAVLAVIGLHAHAKGQLPGNRVVATVMSNLGLERALGSRGIALGRSAVGDRYVYEMMRQTGAAVGGEQSGHILLTGNGSTTGDGVRTALTLLAIMHEAKTSLRELASVFAPAPQKLLNVPLREKPPLETVPGLSDIRGAIEREHGGNVRIVLRYSGTEPKLRIMVEGPDDATVSGLCDRLAVPFAPWRV